MPCTPDIRYDTSASLLEIDLWVPTRKLPARKEEVGFLL